MTTHDEVPAQIPPAAYLSGFTGGAIDIETIKDLTDRAGSEIDGIHLEHPPAGIPAEVPLFIDRSSGNVKSVRALLEEYRTHPESKKGTAKVATLESLIDLTNRHKTAHSVIFADTDWRKPSLTTVVDYHHNESGGQADNGKHRIHYPFPLSEEWNAWIALDGKPLEQKDFAEWIEDHIHELTSPDTLEEEQYFNSFGFKVAFPNELVTLSRGLKVHAETRVKSNVVLQSGEGEISFEEEHKTADGGKLSIPGLFIINIAPFFMGETTRIPVRLRYRVHGGSVTWFFKLYRPDIHITLQVDRDFERAIRETELPGYRGTPEMIG